MARKWVLEDLIDYVRHEADLGDSEHVQNPAIQRALHTGFGELHEEVAEAGMRQFEKTVHFTGADLSEDEEGGAGVAIPDEFLSSIGVDEKIGEYWYDVPEAMVQERNCVANVRGGHAVAHALVDDQIVLYPPPAAAAAFRLVYIPQAADIRAVDPAATTIDVLTSAGEQFLLWYCAAKIKNKEDEDYSYAVAHRDAAMTRVREWAVLRALNNPRRHQVNDEWEILKRRGPRGGEYR
jgi:hypothetical protein